MGRISTPKPADVVEAKRLEGTRPAAPGTIQLPTVPDIGTTDTGVVGPGGATTETGQAQETIDAIEAEATADFAADVGQQEEGKALAAGVEGDISATGERIEGIQTDLETAKADLDAEIDTTKENLSTLAQDATSEFDRLKSEFRDVGAQALDTIDSLRIDAAGQVMEGRATVMQAAVQGM